MNNGIADAINQIRGDFLLLDLDKVMHERVSVGKLTKKIIDLLELDIGVSNIYIDRKRIKHIKKHIKDFQTENDFWNHIEKIDEIIENPDFVGLHPSKESIQYIKKIDEWTLVAVRVKGRDSLTVRTAYPLSQNKLQNYIDAGRLININR